MENRDQPDPVVPLGLRDLRAITALMVRLEYPELLEQLAQLDRQGLREQVLPEPLAQLGHKASLVRPA